MNASKRRTQELARWPEQVSVTLHWRTTLRSQKIWLASQKGPSILVGHSYAGVVISGAANDAPNVQALVYIAAFGLDEGESIDALSKQGPAPAGAAAVLPPDEHGFLSIDRDGFPKAFAADVDAVEARVMAAVQKPLRINSFTAKSGPPAWKHLASWYMVRPKTR